MVRRPLIAGNWKMYTTVAEGVALAEAIARGCAGVTGRDVVVAPPFTSLAAVGQALANTPVKLAAQNVHWEEAGAFTAEIAPTMLRDLGCEMAIVGHSERRHIFGESDVMVNQRIRGALAGGVTPIFCIGETLDQREAGRTLAVLEEQVRAGLAGVDQAGAGRVVLAYEPVWAIGTGKTATVEQAQEVHDFVRRLVATLYEKSIAGHMRILYGGSVKPDNIDALMAQEDVDGALVGGAALDADSFIRIISFA